MLIDPEFVTLDQLERVYSGESIELAGHCRGLVDNAAAFVASAATGDKPIYGVNTGFGKLAHERIPADKVELLQQNLIRSHCSGVGHPLPEDIVRLVIALKVISLARGASGVRWLIIRNLVRLMDAGVMPHIPGKGSVGASGDLAPLAHLTATLTGSNGAYLDGEYLDGPRALESAGLKPVKLGPKEGLAMINGTQVSTALALSGLFMAWKIAMTSLAIGALSADAIMASAQPFRPEIHMLRGHPDQIEAGSVLRTLLTGSEIREDHREGDTRVQDPYCVRCQPQVMGAAISVLRVAGETLRIEAAAATDNPLILPDGTFLSGGNFHGEPVGFAADQIAMAIAEIGSISQRRTSMLVDPVNSFGLPAFLTPDPGVNSGFMVAEIVSAALASENKSLANPRVVDSTPTSAEQEDHVAMSCHAARRLLEMNENLSNIVAIEALCAAQGIDFRRPLKTGHLLETVHRRIRSVVDQLTTDRVLSPDIESVAGLIASGTLMPPIPEPMELSRS